MNHDTSSMGESDPISLIADYAAVNSGARKKPVE
jgi:hypothetical protein